MKNERAFNDVNVHAITIPTGGNSVMQADENFNPNAFTGAASLTIPLHLPAARTLTPALDISYSSGAGNGMLGMGFTLSGSSIAIKTNRGIPQYNDEDVYMLDDTELVLNKTEQTTLDGKNVTVDTFLERFQSGFALIQRLSTDEGVHWRVTGNDNTVSIYGDTDDARISDPQNKQKIFKWMITGESDPMGNRIIYQYTRFDTGDANTYLTSIRYGNYQDQQGREIYAFGVLIDYGQLSISVQSDQFEYDPATSNTPPQRKDVLCNTRPGFLLISRYLVRNILVTHYFEGDAEMGQETCTQWIKLSYSDIQGANACSMLTTLSRSALIRTGENTYRYTSLPPTQFVFTPFSTDQPLTFSPIMDDKGNVINQPLNLVDLYQQGLPGILYRNADTLLYYEAMGNGLYSTPTRALTAPAGFSDIREPLNIVSLEGNGELQLQLDKHQFSGYYPQDDQFQWQPFVPFDQYFLNDLPERTENVDLSGSNRTDLLLITPEKLYYHASLGLRGMQEDQLELDNVTGVEAVNEDTMDPLVLYGFEDVFGDGLRHRLKVEQQQLSIWPNIGYGRFGQMINIKIPGLDLTDPQMNIHHRLIWADVNGSGSADLVLIYPDHIQIFFNYGGLAFSDPFSISFPGDLNWCDGDNIRFADVAGNGNTCLVFSKLSPHVLNGQYVDMAHYYFEFNAPAKGICGRPFLLQKVINHLGMETSIFYKSSLNDLLRDRQQDPWYTHLPFPVVVVSASIVKDLINNTAHTTSYSYRNGYYDPVEHSFLGFGLVTRQDADTDLAGNPLPEIIGITLTRQWFHLGNGFLPGDTLASFFQGGKDVSDIPFVQTPTVDDLTALAGRPLRIEVYNNDKPSVPYTAVSTSYVLHCVQPPSPAAKAVYKSWPCQTLDFRYEQRADDPLVKHQLTLEVDDYNHALKTCSLFYPRCIPLVPEQGRLYCTASQSWITNQEAAGLPRWLGVVSEQKSYEIANLPAPANDHFTYEEIKQLVALAFDPPAAHPRSPAATPDPPHALPAPPVETPNQLAATPSPVQLSLLDWQRQYYWADEQQQSEWTPAMPLPAILLKKYSGSAVFNDTQVQDMLGPKAGNTDLQTAGYIADTTNGYWWKRSAVTHFGQQDDFFLPLQQRYDWADKSSSLYTEYSLEYDPYRLLPISTSTRLNDTITLSTTAKIDYRTVKPWQVTDVNDNVSEVLLDEWGRVIASANYEKQGINGDAPLSAFTPVEIKDTSDVLANPLKYLQQAGNFFYYQFGTLINGNWSPSMILSLSRTVYQPAAVSEVQISISFQDPLGRTLEIKQPADPPGAAKIRWQASSRTRRTITGLPLCTYSGYFSLAPDYQTETQDQNTELEDLPLPTRYRYDALGRTLRVVTPKGYFSATLLLNAWESRHFDENDTVLESDYYTSGQWKDDPQTRNAIDKAIAFYNTPVSHVTDALGRTILTVTDIGHRSPTPIDWQKTRLLPAEADPTQPDLLVDWQSFDISGRVLLQADARFNQDNQGVPPDHRNFNVTHKYPLTEGIAWSAGSDSGIICSLFNIYGKCITEWDAAGIRHAYTYDNLQRMIAHSVQTPEGSQPAVSQVIQYMVYGEAQPSASRNNMLAKEWKRYDGAGLTVTDSYTFDGHPVDQTIRYRLEYKDAADWSDANRGQEDKLLEKEGFTISTRFDAAGRPVDQQLPDGTLNTWTYGPMGNCIASTSDLQGKGNAQPILRSVTRNANGQTESIQYGNGVTTRFDYDPLTLRFTKLTTTAANKPLQQLQCWHDPGGRVTSLQNLAANTIFFDNKQIDPKFDYTYDAAYRLQRASGRSLLGYTGLSRDSAPSSLQTWITPHSPNDLSAAQNYTETYTFDKGNNLTVVQRTGAGGYTRNYTIDAASNRVLSCSQGGQEVAIEYTGAGYMKNTGGMGTASLQWNVLGNIATSMIVEREHGPSDAIYYVYSQGRRVRTITERYDANGNLTELTDKRYVGNYRRTASRNGDVLHSITIGGAQSQDCVLQYKDSGDASNRVTRYQHASPINVMSMETNDKSDIITYEEYSPYGDTMYGYDPAQLASTREYAYNRKEKDPLTGLYDYGFRYYVPWLCRWSRPDPAGTIDGLNLFAFVGNDPVGNKDAMGLCGTNKNKERAPTVSKKRKIEAVSQFQKDNKEAIETYVNKETPTTRSAQLGDSLDKYLKLQSLSAAASAPESGGGAKKDYDKVLTTVKGEEGLNDDQRIAMLFAEMHTTRTLTRYSFVLDKGKQGPHTSARVNVLELNQELLKSLEFKTAANIHQLLYADKILEAGWLEELEDNPADGTPLAEYISHYGRIRDKYKLALTNNDALGVLAHGQSLLDLHPYATSRSLAQGSDISGGGERRGQQDIYKLFDYPAGDRYAGEPGTTFGSHIPHMQNHMLDFLQTYTFDPFPSGFKMQNK